MAMFSNLQAEQACSGMEHTVVERGDTTKLLAASTSLVQEGQLPCETIIATCMGFSILGQDHEDSGDLSSGARLI